MSLDHSGAHGDNFGVGARANRSFSVGGHLLCRGNLAPAGEFPCRLCYTQLIDGYNRSIALPDDVKIATVLAYAACHEAGRCRAALDGLREVSSMAEEWSRISKRSCLRRRPRSESDPTGGNLVK